MRQTLMPAAPSSLTMGGRDAAGPAPIAKQHWRHRASIQA